MSTALYNVLSGLHYSDTLLSTTITTLSGKLSPAFTANSFTVGSGTGLSASQYVLPVSDAKTSAQFGTAKTVATEKNAKTYVDAEITKVNNAALTGVTFNNPISGTFDGTTGKNLTIGVKVDGNTITVSDGKLSSAITLKKLSTASTGFAASYQLSGANGVFGDVINIPKDQFLKSVEYVAEAPSGATPSSAVGKKCLKFIFTITKSESAAQTNGTGTTDTDYEFYLPLEDFARVYSQGTGIEITSANVINWKPTAGNGIGINGATISAKLDTSNNGTDGFLQLSANGLYTSGIKTHVSNVTSAMVTAPSDFAAADQIILANDNKKAVKSSGIKIANNTTGVTDSDLYVPTSKAVSSFVKSKTTDVGMVTTTNNSTNLVNGNLVKATGNKTVADAGVATETTLTDSNAKLPTSKAVSSFVLDQIDTAAGLNVTADTVWGDGNSGKLVITDGAARKVKVSSYSVSTAKITGNSDTTIPTNTAISATLVDYVKGPASVTDNHIAQFNGTTGKLIKGGKAFTDNAVTSTASGNTSVPTNAAIWKTVSGLVSGTVATVTANDFAMFDGTNGRALKDSTVSLQKSTDTNGTTLSSDDKIPTAKAISGYIAAQTANYVVPSGSEFALDEIAIFADDSGKKIATSNKSFSTAAITSGSTDAQIPTAKAVWSTVSGYVSGSGLTAEKIILGNGGQNVKTSSIGILKSTDTGIISDTASSGDTMVPTAGAVAEYVTDGLAGLQTQIETLNTAIAALN